jgi:hypothetical protein
MLSHREPLGTVAYLGGVPAVLEEFCWAWGQMVAFNAEYLGYVHIDHARESVHDFARNELVRRMLGQWIVMLDADHQPPPDIVLRLVTTADRLAIDVLTAMYQYRRPPHLPVWFEDTPHGRQAVLDWDANGAQAIQISAAGAGSLFVRRRVFERIFQEMGEEPFARTGGWGEDHSFFWRLKLLGIPAWGAPGIESGHLAVRPVTLADYERPGIPEGEEARKFVVDGLEAGRLHEAA